jgi:hypothetical protein
MKRGRTLIIAACLPLAACGGWNGAGKGLRLDAPEAVFAQPCPHPADFLGAGDWEIIAGRMGDALIDCEARRAGLEASLTTTKAALLPR